MTQNVFCPSVILSRNEQRPPCRKRPGPWWFHWPHHTQEGTTQVQAEADPHIQEQGPQARPEGVKKKQPLYLSMFRTTKWSHTRSWPLPSSLVLPQLWWRYPRHGGSWHRHHSGVPMGGLRRHGAQRLGQIRHHLNLLPPAYLACLHLSSVLPAPPLLPSTSARHAMIRLPAPPLMPSRLSTSGFTPLSGRKA